MEHVEEHHQTQRGEYSNEGGQYRYRCNDTMQETRHRHNKGHRQHKRQKKRSHQRQQRSSFESHAGSMPALGTICKCLRQLVAGTAAPLYEAAVAAFGGAAFEAAFATGFVFFAAALRTAAHLFLVAAMIALRPAALSLRFFGSAALLPCA